MWLLIFKFYKNKLDKLDFLKIRFFLTLSPFTNGLNSFMILAVAKLARISKGQEKSKAGWAIFQKDAAKPHKKYPNASAKLK